MNNLPLQPLVWIEISEKVRNDPSICELDKGALWIADDNLIFRYNIKNNPNSKELPFIVNYGGRQPKEVDSVEYGKHWAEHTHYASQMQPYVKPMPTWINYATEQPSQGDSIVIALVWMGDKHTIWLESYRPAEIDYLDDCLEVYWSFSPFVKQGE